jgi:hypothetical protein
MKHTIVGFEKKKKRNSIAHQGIRSFEKKYYRKKTFLVLVIRSSCFYSDFAIKKGTENLVPTSLRYF